MKGMAITMEEIAAIKELQAQGFGPYQISAQVGADPKTVRKYMKQDDLHYVKSAWWDYILTNKIRKTIKFI